MSETTPDPTPNAADGEAADAFAGPDTEPSMEDILASIRKIIADDADPVPLDGPAMASEAPSDPAPIVELSDVSLTGANSQSPIGDDELDMTALLDDVAEIEPESVAAPETQDSDDLSLDALMADLSDTLGDDLSSERQPVTDEETTVTDIDADSLDDSDDMDRLMDELLLGLDEDLPDVDPTPEIEEASAANLSVSTTELAEGDDLDLVKSLMEDLTDEDVDEIPSETVAYDLDADLAIPPEPETDDSDDDILDSILNMTLDDEIASLEQQIEAETVDLAPTDDSVPTLADIASAAEADAGTSTAGMKSVAAVAAAAAGTAALVAQTGSDTSDQSVDLAAEQVQETDAEAPQNVAADIKPTESQGASAPAEDNTEKLETPMPRAVRADAILDEVTEEATMSAFAELNQVVEDKAILSERGPRIGDLVQEALKPMLKEWLDANLKGIVERAVAKEVKRISSGK